MGQMVYYLVVIGVEVQVKLVLKTSFLDSNTQIYLFTVLLCSLVFDVVALSISFQGYKLSKEMFYRDIQIESPPSPDNERFPLNQDRPSSHSQKRQFNAFHGQGVKIGK